MDKELNKYFDRLWPICRSITGNGLRESFKILQEIIPLELTEVPTGTKCFDWEIPMEWNINDAYIITPDGKKICEFKRNNLHLVNYSEPVNSELSFDELKEHLHTRPDLPDAVPYVTSYYKRNWGFCLSHNDFLKLKKDGSYKVYIDSSLKNGALTYGETVLKGNSDKEILFSTYLCHPSMANNELSGPLVTAFLYRKLAALKNRKYTYRFVIAPETIGIIAYLSKIGTHLKSNLIAGYVLTCVGTDAPLTYKRSKRGNSDADKAAEHVLKYACEKKNIIPFAIGGSDERQYCSPGFDLPVGSFIRSVYQQYPEYHTSLDDKSIISFKAMEETIDLIAKTVLVVEQNERLINKNPYCEVQLGKRGLYPETGGTWSKDIDHTRKILHVLAFSDGKNDLIDIAEKRDHAVWDLTNAVTACRNAGLI